MTKSTNQNENIVRRLVDRIKRRRFAYLTKSLLLLIILYPYVRGDNLEQVLLSLLTTAVMIMSVIAVGDKRRHTIIALILAAPWFLIVLSRYPIAHTYSAILFKEEIVFAFLLFAYTTYRIFMHIIRSRDVTTEILFASISVYLLIGLTWAAAYAIVNIYDPGSFVDRNGSAVNSGPEFLFFSYITLTAVGYGNIEAISNQARTLASIEALSGQLYLTIMVARLVGLHISKPKSN